MTARHWCFTLNNYTQDELDTTEASLRGADFTYVVVGREIGENNTPHLQGYFQCNSPWRLGRCKRIPGLSRAHFEKAKGTGLQNKQYCTKESCWLELGSISHQGKRNDLLEVKRSIDQGKSIADLAQLHFDTFVKYSRGIILAANLLMGPRNWRTQVIYLYGPTETGKSKLAHDESLALTGGSACWLSDPTLQWFDGWMPGRKGVVIDDFDGSPKLPLLLRLFDRYPMKVPIKGGFLEWNPRIVWITSNYSLEHWYGTQGEHYNALKRRIDEIKQIL
jgi:hypothetical protein